MKGSLQTKALSQEMELTTIKIHHYDLKKVNILIFHRTEITERKVFCFGVGKSWHKSVDFSPVCLPKTANSSFSSNSEL